MIWSIFFWRFGDLKNESHFLKKKPPLGPSYFVRALVKVIFNESDASKPKYVFFGFNSGRNDMIGKMICRNKINCGPKYLQREGLF